MRTGEQIIADVAETVTERRKGYGRPAENFRSIAIGWQEILKCEVTARQVALCMDWLKSCRLISQPDHEDSVLDKMGYAMCYADCGEPEQEQPEWSDEDIRRIEELELVLNTICDQTITSPFTDDGNKRPDTADPAQEGWSGEVADLARVRALRQRKCQETADPAWLDAPLPDYMTYRECRTCHWPVDCRTKGACREASRDPA